jgi:hypothetical protein
VSKSIQTNFFSWTNLVGQYAGDGEAHRVAAFASYIQAYYQGRVYINTLIESKVVQLEGREAFTAIVYAALVDMAMAPPERLLLKEVAQEATKQ